jgi:hypothetical protein
MRTDQLKTITFRTIMIGADVFEAYADEIPILYSSGKTNTEALNKLILLINDKYNINVQTV